MEQANSNNTLALHIIAIRVDVDI